MRKYLYLWHQPEANRLVASGIEFRDFLPELASSGGIVLLRHRFDEATHDAASRFDYVSSAAFGTLNAEDVNGFGDFVWADFGREVSLEKLSDPAIAALAFFGHAARPLDGVVPIEGLANRRLCYAHDDGWYSRLFYRDWDALSPMLSRHLSALLDPASAATTLERVRRGETAAWCADGRVIACEGTEGIDALQNRHL